MKHMAPLILLLLFAESGCLGNPAVPSPHPMQPTCPTEPTPLNISIETAPPTVDFACGALVLKELLWSSRIKGDLAFQLKFDLGQANKCTGLTYFAGVSRDRSVQEVGVHESNYGTSIGWGGPAEVVKARIGSVDSSRVVPVDNGWMSGGGFYDVPFTGQLNVTEGALGLSPGTGLLPGDASIQALFRCSEPFRLVQASASREVRIFRPGSFDGGLGAKAWYPVPLTFLESSAEYGGSIQKHFDSENVVFRAQVKQGSAGTSTGEMMLQRPGGRDSWAMDGPLVMGADGPSGDYALRLTRVGTGRDDLTGLLIGLNPISNLSDLESIA